MNILLVEDEPGIREGLAAVLRRKGHVVRAADSCARGCELAAAERFDLIVTDWRLGDGVGAAVVAGSACPVVVMTGYPDEVSLSREATVLRKPVAPAALLAEIERRAGPRPPRAAAAAGPPDLPDLPRDTRDRIALAWALAGGDGRSAVLDEGDTVVLRAALAPGRDQRSVLARLEALGGDARVVDRGGAPVLELRFYRDGRPDGAAVVGLGEPWPDAPAPVAVDLHGADACDPARFVELVEAAARSAAAGRTVWLLNTPPHLRLHLELIGRRHLLPKRPRSGPRLPEVLSELWRQG